MENIGKLLKEKRLEMGMSVEDVSKKTRLTQKHIKAIEEGDIKFFHNDLSYLRFFVKSYCEVLHIDFEEIKDDLRESVDDYTTTFTMAAQQTHHEIEKHVANSEKLTSVQSPDAKTVKTRTTKKSTSKVRSLKKTDFSLVSLVAVVGLVAIVIICAFVLYWKNDSGKPETDKNEKQPVANVQKENGENQYPATTEKEKEKEKEKEQDTSKNITVTQTDVTHYTIDNAKEGDELNFEVTFGGSSSAFSVTVDGVVLADPASKAYEYLSTVKAKVVAKKGMRIQLYFGWLNATSMKLNGKNVKIDDSIVNSNSSAILEFTVTEAES